MAFEQVKGSPVTTALSDAARHGHRVATARAGPVRLKRVVLVALAVTIEGARSGLPNKHCAPNAPRMRHRQGPGAAQRPGTRLNRLDKHVPGRHRIG